MDSSTRLSQALSNLERVTTHLNFLSAKKKTDKSKALKDTAEEAEEQFQELIPLIRRQYPLFTIHRESDTILRLRMYEAKLPLRKYERPYIWIKYEYEHELRDDEGPYGPASLFKVKDYKGHWYFADDINSVMDFIYDSFQEFKTKMEKGIYNPR
jgi:hypothetical protein